MGPKSVLKFGGAALTDAAAVRRVCTVVDDWRTREGTGPVVVVSAFEGMTDALEELAYEAARGRGDLGPVRVRHRALLRQLELPSDLLDRYWRNLAALLVEVASENPLAPASLDRVLSFGERLSARIIARALGRYGVPATPVDAWDLGLVTDSRHGQARPLEGQGAAIAAALREVPGVPIVTGFLAKDQRGRLTTLGRNGSDLTAAILAEALGAGELVYWKGVPGILTADPADVPEARLLPQLTYAEAGELAFHGAEVLHPAAVAPARRARVKVRVASLADPQAPGTTLVERSEGAGPRAVAVRDELLLLRLAIELPEEAATQAARLFGVLGDCDVTPWLTGSEDGCVWALVDRGLPIPTVLERLGSEASVERDLATVTLVGQDVGCDPDLVRAASARLAGVGIVPRRAAVATRALVEVVDRDRRRAAARALHSLIPDRALLQN